MTRINDLKNKVYVIRDVQVMFDFDLAEIYGYETKTLNQQVKRNINRFPEDFMFQITRDEIDLVKSQIVTLTNPKDTLRSQIVTSKKSKTRDNVVEIEEGSLRSQIATSNNIKEETRGGRQYLPYVFTEQGIYMLATVLKCELAEKQSIFIMRAFKEMRHFIQQNMQFVTKDEIKLITDSQENRFIKIEKDIDKINQNFLTNACRKNFVIYKGQKFEADKAYIDIYQNAKKTIFIIDDYINIKTLELLSHKKSNVDVIIFSDNKGRRSGGYLTQSEIDDFNEEFPSLVLKLNNECHDRFIIVDYNTKYEIVYICGASSKDAGKKVCTINILETNEMIHPIVDKLIALKK